MSNGGPKKGRETKTWEIWIFGCVFVAGVCIAISMTNGSMTFDDLIDLSKYGFAPGTPPEAMIGVGVVMLIIVVAGFATRSRKSK